MTANANEEWRGEAHRVLPRYFQRELRASAATRTPPTPAAPIRTATTPVDGLAGELRGIPAIGRGVGGAIAGTDPFRAAANKARDRQRPREIIG